MLKAVGSLTGEINAKQCINGKINNAIIKIEPNYEELTLTPSADEQVQEGTFNKVTVLGDSDLIAENIKEGVELFGVTGTAKVQDEDDKYNAKMLEKISGTSAKIYKYLVEIPQLDTSDFTSMYGMFDGCENLITIPQLNTSKVTNMQAMLAGCSSLTSVPSLDTSKVTSMYGMFSGCRKLTSVPSLDTSKVTNMQNMFYNCDSLITLPTLDTDNVTTFQGLFGDCDNLTTAPLLNASKVATVCDAASYCPNLIDLGGFEELGKGYTNRTTANYYYCTLNLSYSKNLTYDSLMNVINNLYDLNLTYNVAGGGTLYTQSLKLGSENLAKLTAEEIAVATAKGWTVS